MNRILQVILLFAISPTAAHGQTFTWTEDFDAPSYRDSVHTVFNGTHGFDSTDRIAASPNFCDTAFVGVGDTIELRTDTLFWMGNTYVILSFDHICKIDFFDGATVQVSPDFGSSWFPLTTEYITDDLFGPYPNSSNFENQGYVFNESSWVNDWLPGNAAAIPDNTWWRTEYFDLSNWATTGLPLIVRWILIDGSSPPGGNGKYGWAIDNIRIEAAPCEVTPPAIGQAGIPWQNIVFDPGPYTVTADVTDNSGIDTVRLHYSVNGGPVNTMGMVNVSGNLYEADIPSAMDGDTICYSVDAVDASACMNQAFYPGSGCIEFIVSDGLDFPFCDNFDGTILWTDSTTVIGTGSPWEMGTPNYSTTTGAHSPPNAWDIALGTPYLNNTSAYLYSPVFSTPAVNSKLSFWINYTTQSAADGTWLEYSTDNGNTWTSLGNLANTCNCQTGWHNSNISCSNADAWSGSSGGWQKAEYVFDSNFPFGLNLRLRFRFCSNVSVTGDGVSIDDFCIEEPTPFDAGVESIDQPFVWEVAGGCEPVIVTIRNHGLDTLTDFDLYYAIDGMVSGPFPWNGSLPPGIMVQDTLPCFTVPAGPFSLCAWTDQANDGNHFNDTACADITGVPVLGLSTCDDLESGNQGYLVSTTTPAMNWQLGTPAYGLTMGAYSGANAWDVNLSTVYANNASCTLSTAIYDITGAINPSFSFWQNRHINVNDGLYVEYTLDGGSSWSILWDGSVPSMPGTALNWYTAQNFSGGFPGWNGNSQGWQHCIYYLDDVLAANPSATQVQFRFIYATSFNGPLSGVSIDDICMTQPGPQDAGVILVSSPMPGSSAPVGNTSPVEVAFQNFGSTDIISTDITWALNGNTVSTTSWTGTLPPGGVSPPVVLDSTLTYVSGGFELCAYTQLVSDTDTTNDTTCIQLVGIPIIPLTFANGYCDDFESGNAGWTVQNNGDSATTWELGTPAYNTTNSAHSGTNAWDINLTTTYSNNAEVYLLSPFFDFSNAADAKLSFWRNHQTEQPFDGVRLDYQVGGGNWTIMGFAGAGAPYFNWYNSMIGCSNDDAWNGGSQGWVQSRMDDLGQLAIPGQGNVRFRFAFCSDAVITEDGFSLDDFCIEIPVPLTAAPVKVGDDAPFPLVFTGQNIVFNADISNKGTAPLTSVDAQLWIGTNMVGTDNITYTPALPTGGVQNHNFTSYPWLATAGSHDICVITDNPNASTDLDPADDTACYVLQVIDTISVTGTASYCDDFESGQPLWTSLSAFTYSPTSSWKIGTPNKVNLTSAHSFPNAWVTGVSVPYPSPDTSALFTPAFTIDPGNRYKLSFWHQYATEIYQDGCAVDYSTDYGNSWQSLGQYNPGTFWYTSPFVISFGLPPTAGWSGSVAGYIFSEQEMCFGPGEDAVMFRFRFQSDFSISGDGWAIDDVCFESLGPDSSCITSVQEHDTMQGFLLGQNIPNPVSDMTAIPFTLPGSGQVVLEVYDLAGQVVLRQQARALPAGRHAFRAYTRSLAPGVYHYAVTWQYQRQVRKMVIIR